MEWERFYTESKKNPEKVDQIEIDAKHKCYRLYLNERDEIIDGTDEYGEEVFSCFVSRLVFDIIVRGIQEQYTLLCPETEEKR